MIALVGRIVFMGMKSNIGLEFLGLLGAIVSTFVTLHYYVRLSKFLHESVFVPKDVSEVLAFIILWLTIYVVFKLIISGWSLILKGEAHPIIDKWGGLIISFLSSVLVCGLFFMLFLLAGNDYMRKISKQSFTGYYLVDISPTVYGWMYDQGVSKYFPDEPLNADVFHLKDKEDKKKDKHKK
jgi:uncharacterized membrane protein required for colicin V production